jgi:hypothetical protein
MGYACPVCEEPQRDAEHLANHLAFQALTGRDDHEAWLDDHVPDWATGGPADLAPRVADLADEAEYEVVFDDTTGGEAGGPLYDPDRQGDGEGHGHEHGQAHGHGRAHEHGGHDPPARSGGTADGDDLNPAARDVLREARELTRRMYADGDERGSGTEDETGAGGETPNAGAGESAAGDAGDGTDGDAEEANGE